MAGSFFFNLRNRLLRNPSFRLFAEKTPLLQGIARRNAYDLFRMAGGFIHSQVLGSCVKLGIFDLLKDGSLPLDEIASKTSVPAERLVHLLRAAAALRLLDVRPQGGFGLGVLGASVVDSDGMKAIFEHHALLYRDLVDPVAMFRGDAKAEYMQSLWSYAGDANEAGLGAGEVSTYTELMGRSQTMVAEQVLDAWSMKDCRNLLDIGGGSGVFATAAGARWPSLALTIADLPPVAEIARERLAASEGGSRVTVIGANAVTDTLPGGFDIVSFIRILHDHDDDIVRKLLANARTAVADTGTLLIGEPLADAPGAGPLIDAYFNVYLLAMGSGRPRRFDELKTFLEEAGFEDVRLRRTRIPLITSVITAKPTISNVKKN